MSVPRLSHLVDAQAMRRRYPRQFETPMTTDLEKIAPGWVVKICRHGERFWVLVTKVTDRHITGAVNNHLVNEGNADLPAGTLVRFERRHVYSIWAPATEDAAT